MSNKTNQEIKIQHIGVLVQLENGDVHQAVLTELQEKLIMSILISGQDKIKLNITAIETLKFAKV